MITIKISQDLHPQCNFCLSQRNINKVSSSKTTLVISICDKCLETIYNTNNEEERQRQK